MCVWVVGGGGWVGIWEVVIGEVTFYFCDPSKTIVIVSSLEGYKQR